MLTDLPNRIGNGLDPNVLSALSDIPSLAPALPATIDPTQFQPQAPAAAFQWGPGGQMMLPEEIARRRQMAQAMEQTGMDYSPVKSWAEGMARVAQGLVGGIEERRLNKAAQTNADYSRFISQNLMGSGQNAAPGSPSTPGAPSAPGTVPATGSPGMAASPGSSGGLNRGMPSAQALMAAIASPYVSDAVKESLKIALKQYYRDEPLSFHQTNTGDWLGIDKQTGQVVSRSVDDHPKPVVTWQQADNGDGTKTLVPFGPNGPVGGGYSTAAPPPTRPVGKLTPIPDGGPTPPASGTFPQ